MIDGESKGGDCDKVFICTERGEPGGEQNEVDGMKKGADSTGKGDAYVKERLVICNEEDTDGRGRVTRDEERVLPYRQRWYWLFWNRCIRTDTVCNK